MDDRFGGNIEEEEDDITQEPTFGGRDGLVFLIDCSRLMADSGGAEGGPLQQCLQCVLEVIQNKIISSHTDLLAVVLFGTEKMKNATEFKNIYIFQGLLQPGADHVLEVEKLLEEVRGGQFAACYGHSDDVSISDALWTCSTLFSTCTQKLGFKSVMLFTNNDNPHEGNAQMKRQAAAKVEDLQQNGIELDLMHVTPPEGHRPFDLGLFYKRQAAAKVEDLQQNGIELDLMHMTPPEGHRPFDLGLFYKDVIVSENDDATVTNAAQKFADLRCRVRMKEHRKRVTSRVPLSLGPGLQIAVGVYNLARHTVKPTPVKLYKRTNEEVQSITKIFFKETAELILPHDLKKSMQFAGRHISFEQEEVAEMKSFGEPGLILLGFKPSDAIKCYFHIRPAQFIYPDSVGPPGGSTRLFSALLSRCADRDLVIICRYIARKISPPRYVALFPQLEEVDKHGVQVAPPGFHLVFLPFAADFLNLDAERNVTRASEAQVGKAKELIRQLKFRFNSDQFDNTQLRHHYANIEALALDRDAPDTLTDFTVPDDVKMMEKAGDIISEFKDLVFPVDYEPRAKKRPAAKDSGSKTKMEKLDTESINMREEATAGRLHKLTVPVLKQLIKTANIRVTGSKKGDLIDAINSHCDI